MNIYYYPININIAGKRCLVAGGGKVAERKVKRLLDCGADVTLISPQVTAELKKMAEKKNVLFIKRRARAEDIKGAFLVICASNDRRSNASVAGECRKKGVLVNVADMPSECNFTLPSVVSRGNLSISVSTNGVSPALSKKIRRDLEKIFGGEYAAFLRLMKKLRPAAIAGLKSRKKKAAFFKRALAPDILGLLKKGKFRQAEERLQRLLRNGQSRHNTCRIRKLRRAN